MASGANLGRVGGQGRDLGKRPRDEGETKDAAAKHRARTEKQLAFGSPGTAQSVAQPELLDSDVRTTRSGKRFSLPFAAEVERDDIFVIGEGSRAERALDLAMQLKERVLEMGPTDEENDGDASDWDAGDAPATTVEHAFESLEQQLEDEQNSRPCSVALLGPNGAGKSFLINLLFQVTEVREDEYALNSSSNAGPAKDFSEKTLRKHLFDTLEGSLELRKSNAPWFEEGLKIDQGQRSGDQYMAEREEEERILNIIKKVHTGVAPNREEKRGFVLPSAGVGVSTTKIAVKARQGKVYHLLVRYRSEKDIRDELADFDWDQLDSEDIDLDDEESSEAVNANYKLDMLLAIAGLGVESRDSVPKPRSSSDVQICATVREKIVAHHELVAGRGRSLLDDRMFIRKRLWEVMDDPIMVYILHECVVYIPADALEGLELIDAPGTGVVSPQEQKALQDVRETADALVVCMQRNLEDCKDIKPVIQSCVQFQKLIETTAETPGGGSPCQVFFFSAMDEQGNFTRLDTPQSVDSLEKSKRDIANKNRKGLKQMLKTSIAEMRQNGRLAASETADTAASDALLEACLKSLEANMYSSYPLLWASVSMSPGEKESAPHPSSGGHQPAERTSRARKQELLVDVTKLLAAIRGQSGRAASIREDHILGAFLDKVKSVEPSQGPVEGGSGLTDGMQERARQEAIRRTSRAFDHELSEIEGRFEQQVYLMLQKHFEETFVNTALSNAADEMVADVKEEDVVRLVHKQMDGLSSQQWRTLQLAFARELKGSYTKLSLFKSFFGKFALPDNSELERSIKSMRDYAAELVQQFMIKDMVLVLGKGTRQASGVSEAVKKLVRKAVEYCVPVSGASHVLEEALGVLNRGLKGGHKSLQALLYEAQVESLQLHLLSRNSADGATDTAKDRRKRDGRWLHNHYKKIVSAETSKVIEGAKHGFEQKVREVVSNILKELKSRFLTRRGKSQRLPVLFKLRRACFKRLVHLYGAADAGPNEGDGSLPLLLEEFSCKWQALLVDGAKHDTHQRLLEAIESRHLIINLERAGNIPARCQAKQGKVFKTEPTILALTVARAILDTSKQGTAGADLLSYPDFREKLRQWRLELGYSPTNSSGLFWTLHQFLHDERLQEPGSDQEGAASSEDDSKVIKLREAIVRLVLLKHTTPNDCQRFRNLYGEPLQEWARRMILPEEPGDAICIEYFARHFRVSIRLYSPARDNPVQFPLLLGVGDDTTSQQVATSVYRIAHVPFEPGRVVNKHHYVPIWQSSVRIAETPLGTPRAEEEEYNNEGGSMKSLTLALSGEREKRRDSASERTARYVARWWKEEYSKSLKKTYFVHKASGESVWPEDLEAVRNDTHKKIKIPGHLPK